jgi:DNA-binding transcriptional LysR family regulator
MFDWEDLRHFVALAESGTLSGAARRLRVDHATVGRRVAALEAALGIRLVDRLPRRCVLTELGQRIAALASEMGDSSHAIERAARGVQVPAVAGRVTVSAPPIFASHFLAPRLAPLRRQHPKLRLVLSGEAASVSLSRQEADIAVRLGRPKERSSVMRRLGAMRFDLYAAREYEAVDTPAAWEFIAYSPALDHLPQQQWLRAVAGERPVVFEAGDLASQLAVVHSGVGVAVLPAFLAAQDPELVRLPASPPAPVRELWLVVHADLRRAPAIRAVIDFLTTLIAKSGAFNPEP